MSTCLPQHLINKIKGLGLTNRAYRALCRYCYYYGIDSIDTLKQQSEEQLIRGYGLGRKSAQEIIKALLRTA